MDRVDKKLFFVWNEDKEKKYLEEMALDGYQLVEVGFGKYSFKKIERKSLIYDFDFKGFDSITEDEYLQIFEDAGWQMVAQFGGWYYFAYEAGKEDIDISIFNNNASRKRKYGKLLLFLILTGFPLYYQILFFWPYVLSDDLSKGLASFYSVFRVIAGIFAIVHFLVLVRIFRMYNHINTDIME